MTGPVGPDHDYPQGGAPQGQPGWNAGAQPGCPPPGYGQAPGYGPAPAYTGAPASYVPSLSFADGVRSALTQYAVFAGRARRSEYWWFVLFNLIASIVASVLDTMLSVNLFGWIVSLALLLPGLAVGARRLHDTGRSGWWLLIGIVPLVGVIVLIVFFAQDSQAGPNRYGPSPKYPLAGS